MPQQPSGMNSDNGCILTAGFVCNGEAFAYVMPLVTDATSLGLDEQCKDCATSFQDAVLGDVLSCLSVDGFCSYIQATGMTPGAVPFRIPYGPSDNPGTDSGSAAPTQVAALGVIYQDPADEGIGVKRIRQARTFFAGLSLTSLNGNFIGSTLRTSINTVMTELQAGFVSEMSSSNKWYRVLDVPKPTSSGQTVKRLLVPEVRGGVYTQKRRLVPRQS
jgi:hypothetical protein